MPRLFFALWPNEAVRDELHKVAQTVQRDGGGRVMRRHNLHQTLVFIGTVAAEKMAELEAVAGEVRAAPFTFEFGTTAYWKHNRIVWAAPRATPQPLANLVAALEQGLAQRGMVFDRRAYVPHITLVRDARAPALLPPLRFEWTVIDFVLVESVPGPRSVDYRVAARWPLNG